MKASADLGDQLPLPLGEGPHAKSSAAQATMAFLLRLRARGIADVAVLRALETVPRDLFVPHRYVDLALRDIALPIACGQTMPEPMFIARLMEALDVRPQHRVLEIGTGSGYSTAILARLAAEVVSVEYFEPLAAESRARLASLGIDNVNIIRDDGLVQARELGLFDRIVAHGVVEGLPASLVGALAEGGSIAFARRDNEGKGIFVKIAHEPAKGMVESILFPCRMTNLLSDTPQHRAPS